MILFCSRYFLKLSAEFDLGIGVGSVGTPDKFFTILQILKKTNQNATRHQTENCINMIHFGFRLWVGFLVFVYKSCGSAEFPKNFLNLKIIKIKEHLSHEK
jgi:hypothetical protein